MALSLVGLASARYSGSAAGPANRGTVPPSSYGGNLVSTPSPVDNTGNLVMTGNVSGGKSFRGSVPYGSTTSFGSRLGSASLDPFLRYSSIPEEFRGSSSDYSPFYSPTGTVPKIPPGDSGVFAPGSPRVAAGRMASRSEQPADVITVPEAPQPQVSAGRTSASGDTGTQAWQGLRPVPLSTTPDEMRQIVTGGLDQPPTGKGPQVRDIAMGPPSRPSTQTTSPMSAEEYRRQVDQLQRDLDRVKTNASEFEQSLRTDRQSYTPALGQTPAEASAPMASGEALRRIIQPQSQSPYSTANPPGNQGLWRGDDGVLPSQGQLTRQVPGGASSAGGVLQTPGGTLGYIDAAPPGRMQSQAAAGFPELTLVSPQNSMTDVRVRTAPNPRPPLYGQPAAPASSSSNETSQKSRMDAIFAPQTRPGGLVTPRSGDKNAGLPALQRVQELARGFDVPAAILARSQTNAAADVPPAATSAGAGSQPRLVIAGAPVQSDADLANAVQELGSGTPLSPSPARPVAETEGARIAVEPAPEMVPSRILVPPMPGSRSGGPGAAQTAGTPPKSPGRVASPSGGRPAPNPAPVVLPPDTPFDRHMRSAQLSMQQGQYARAAETFSLAATCNPKDVRPLLGRSHALFAAGAYLDSTVYLAKAIEFDPWYVLRKSDVLEAVGGPDVFVQRITDLEKRAKTGDAPMLHLLLAYMYQQMNQSQQATVAIQAARKGLPSSRAVDLLARAIAGAPPA